MTGRQVLKKAQARQQATMFAAALIGLAIILTACALGKPGRTEDRRRSHRILITGVLSGSVIPVAGIFWSMTMARCPWCRANLVGLGSSGADLARVRCCPYCTKSLDDEAPGPGQGSQSKGKPLAKGVPWDDELA